MEPQGAKTSCFHANAISDNEPAQRSRLIAVPGSCPGMDMGLKVLSTKPIMCGICWGLRCRMDSWEHPGVLPHMPHPCPCTRLYQQGGTSTMGGLTVGDLSGSPLSDPAGAVLLCPTLPVLCGTNRDAHCLSTYCSSRRRQNSC